ncbi:Stress response protein nst1 [Mortierella claussenii]|nr:Stress response protein nst1 [Mortierella claussenii]
MTKHFAPLHHDHSMAPPTPSNPALAASLAAATASASHASVGMTNGARGSSAASSQIGLMSSATNSSHKKKKKKKTKKKTLDRIEEADGRSGQSTIHFTGAQEHTHHSGCQHDHAHHHNHRHHNHHHLHDSGHHHHHEEEDEDDEDFYSDEDAYDPETPAFVSKSGSGDLEGQTHVGSSTVAYGAANSHHAESSSSKKKKKKRKKSTTTEVLPLASNHNGSDNNQHNHSHSHGGISPNSTAMVQAGHRNGHDRSMAKHMHDGHTQNDGFWHYSDAEERQRIREFWFQLREEERRSLVRVEKEAVLKKMKEQQRHSCSCSLCGRKRTAIEEELELLYDAYYDELEQYANQQQPSDGHTLTYAQHSPVFEDDLSDESRGSDEEDEEDDEEDEDDDEEGYEDEDEEDDYEDEIANRKAPFPYRSGFSNTLQAKGNILTVAEDLLENDGKKFLEMMDRLADRKVQRDDELMDSRGVYEEYDDEEEGDFEDEGAEEDALTKEQRMEEGRRMFQAFAARMFEQRVLSAYREKVAQERQERLLAELEEESRQEQLREERREREKERKRDKKRLQRQQKEEEKAAKEAQRLAEEKRLLEERERKLEADRKRREDERRAKEEEKRLREEERHKKEEERKRKIKEEKAREVEKERKRKEELLIKEREEEARKASLEAQRVHEERCRVEEEAREEASRLEREAFLKLQLAEEQRRQEDLRKQEQLAQDELAKQDVEAAAAATLAGAPVSSDNSPYAIVHDGAVPTSPRRDRMATSGSEISDATQGPQGLSPTNASSVSPVRASEPLNSQSIAAQGSPTPLTNNLWANSYPTQAVPQPQLQQMFAQPLQQGLFRPPAQFGHIGGELDAFPSRMGHPAGRGNFMGAPHQSQSPFQNMPQHQVSSNQIPQQMGGMRSPGLAPIGFGQSNVPTKQLLTLMNPNSASGSHEMSNNAGSPLHSPSTLGAIGTPIGSFGPISPIGHARRTSTPYGLTSGDTIKPIQRPVPIGRPKDNQTHSHISSSFDGISLGLSGLTLGAELEQRPRSPPLNLTGGSSLDLDGVAFGKEALRPSGNSVDAHGMHGFANDGGPLQTLSPGIRNVRDTSFFNSSFFSSHMNGHDFSSFGQQQQGHGSLPNTSHFMSPYAMHLSSPPHNQQQQLQQQQQQLFLQQQYMHPNLQDLQQLQQLQQQQQHQHQQQQMGLGSPPLNGSNSWGRSSYMRPPHMNGLGGTAVNSSSSNKKRGI